MASSQEYVNFIVEQLRRLPGVSARKMMGEYVLYCDGKVIGGIYDDRFLIKATEAGIQMVQEPKWVEPYPGAKRMLLVEEVDDLEFLEPLILATCGELPPPKPKKERKK